jgi:hypothetical protein
MASFFVNFFEILWDDSDIIERNGNIGFYSYLLIGWKNAESGEWAWCARVKDTITKHS